MQIKRQRPSRGQLTLPVLKPNARVPRSHPCEPVDHVYIWASRRTIFTRSSLGLLRSHSIEYLHRDDPLGLPDRRLRELMADSSAVDPYSKRDKLLGNAVDRCSTLFQDSGYRTSGPQN
ncbi:hypothetical protein N7468_007102 [Penicillium chermesinum]|uniref:Uncharacterized protein n=1 Tax=Penicillium chermesinum TaxID=63820 RepID=A0A9W9NTJ5_9EURO|nr:uncharacterized protein N7468_007102 [Penicillium chermesinum]KAJ5225877.1 hypothetical protein N7468_007102 [Penicillium chermesinum]